jgi:hypothetical protein
VESVVFAGSRRSHASISEVSFCRVTVEGGGGRYDKN